MKCSSCEKRMEFEELTGCIYYDDDLEEMRHGYLCDSCWETIAENQRNRLLEEIKVWERYEKMTEDYIKEMRTDHNSEYYQNALKELGEIKSSLQNLRARLIN